MVDASSVFDFTGEKNPNVFNIMSVLLLTLLISDITFTSFRLNKLGALVTGFLFIITIIAAIGFTDNLLFTEGHPLAGNFGFTLMFLGLNLGNLLGGFKLSLLSLSTQSYLSGILGSSAEILTATINLVFAPIGETFLIILGMSAGIYTIVKRTSLSDQPFILQYLLVAVPPSLIFSVLHGSRGFSFLLISFVIHMVWVGILFFGEFGKIGVRLLPISTGLIVGFHMGFNTSSFGGVGKFFDVFIQGLSSSYSRSSALILIYMALNFAFTGLYLWSIREEVI